MFCLAFHTLPIIEEANFLLVPLLLVKANIFCDAVVKTFTRYESTVDGRWILILCPV